MGEEGLEKRRWVRVSKAAVHGDSLDSLVKLPCAGRKHRFYELQKEPFQNPSISVN